MDKYGDCFRGSIIEVEEEAVTIRSTGGAPYDTLICEMNFKSMMNDKLCVSFEQLDIERCDLTLTVFPEQDSSGHALVSNLCHSLNRLIKKNQSNYSMCVLLKVIRNYFALPLKNALLQSNR